MSSLDPATEANPFGYSEAIWKRFAAPARVGPFPDGTPGVFTGQAGTPAARSVLRIQFLLDAGTVADARFLAYGCPTSIAVGDWMAEWALGKTPVELRGLSVATLRQALEISDDRAHCAVLGEDAMRAAVAQIDAQTR